MARAKKSKSPGTRARGTRSKLTNKSTGDKDKSASKSTRSSKKLVETLTDVTRRVKHGHDVIVSKAMKRANATDPKVMRLLFVLLLILPQIALWNFGNVESYKEQLRAYYESTLQLDRLLEYARRRDMAIVFLMLFFERMCYTFVWFNGNYFASQVRKHKLTNKIGTAVDNVVILFFVSKALSVLAYGGWMYSIGAGCGVFDLSSKSAFQLILGLQLIAVGQLLNAAIYAAIGKDGVYYGFKLGVTVPWVSGFPFNMGVAHPQYLGATLSIFGVQLLLCTDELASNGWFFIGIMQAIQYLYMSIVESM